MNPDANPIHDPITGHSIRPEETTTHTDTDSIYKPTPTHFHYINHEKIYTITPFISTYEKLSLLSHATATLLFYQDIAQQVLYHAMPMGLA